MLEAVLLDRDGVINRERSDYVKSWSEFEILPGSLKALAILARLNLPILVISNQSAIGRGIVTAETVERIHNNLRDCVESNGGRIDRFYVCPHRPDDGCSCRKPAPGLLLQAATDYSLDLQNCIFVGDSITDRQAAYAADCRSLLVETGRQGSDLREMSLVDEEFVTVKNLRAAVGMILADS